MMQENISLVMIRETLDNIPKHVLPKPFRFSWYTPGFEDRWVEIQKKADKFNEITGDLFIKEFGTDQSLIAHRQLYILDSSNEPIATATAWHDEKLFGKPVGRVHWVAVVSGYQGRGLAKPLLSTVCGKFVAFGYNQAFLVTSSLRIPAIRLYKHFGFIPYISNEKERITWRMIDDELQERYEESPLLIKNL